MQQDLARAGFNPGAADGKFGPNTKNALMGFQRAHGLSVDGVCGPQSWGALTSSYQPTTPAKPTTPTTPPSSSGGSDPVLREGASGSAVTKLQQLLQKAGCNPGGIDGKFGAGTQAAVMSFQGSRGLSVDGVVGPQTWHALETGAPAVSGPGPVSGSVRQNILSVAESQIGTLEYNDNNTGPCEKYPNYFGRGSESWCADFASWVYTHAGDNMNNPYCPSIVNNLKAEGKWKGQSNPQPGDLVLFDWNGDGTADHVGIVKGVNSDGSIETIEGNSDKPGTNQSGVWEHTRYMGTIMGFGNP
jgi:peptidoglycan hydrolase-like protein with peptidoglycan-binding domain